MKIYELQTGEVFLHDGVQHYAIGNIIYHNNIKSVVSRIKIHNYHPAKYKRSSPVINNCTLLVEFTSYQDLLTKYPEYCI